VGLVAAGLSRSDEVVVPEGEFHSLLLPLLVAADRSGTTVKRVPFIDIANAISPTTTLVATSHVRSDGGTVQDLDDLGAAARAVGARILVDASHSAGLLPINAARRGLDFVVCAGYKHLLCPRGVAFMRISEEEQPRLTPINASWVGAHRAATSAEGPTCWPAMPESSTYLSLGIHGWERSNRFEF
jgi:selenocysteine lyase/cysteine desulfurase